MTKPHVVNMINMYHRNRFLIQLPHRNYMRSILILCTSTITRHDTRWQIMTVEVVTLCYYRLRITTNLRNSNIRHDRDNFTISYHFTTRNGAVINMNVMRTYITRNLTSQHVFLVCLLFIQLRLTIRYNMRNYYSSTCTIYLPISITTYNSL